MYAILCMQAAYIQAPNAKLTIQVEGADQVTFIDSMGQVMESDITKGLTVTENGLVSSDPEVFRKLWMEIPGRGQSARVTVTGTWGDDRTSEVEKVIGNARAHVFVATGGFAGPFGIHVTVFDDAPDMEVDKREVELVRGETEIIGIGLEETTGNGPVTRVMLITHADSKVVADVDTQGIDVPAGGVDALGLTVSLSQNAKGGSDWTMVVTSSTSPPVPIEIAVVDSTDSPAVTVLYWGVIVVLVLLVVIFFILPQMGKDEEEPVLEPEEAAEPEPPVEPGDGPEGE
jgi:hypothetical protein